MLKKRNRAVTYTHSINYRISSTLRDEITKLMLPKQTLSAYARSVVDPARILPLQDNKKIKQTIATLRYFSAEFDAHVKLMRGINNRTSVESDSVDLACKKLELFLIKLIHFLYEIEAEFKAASSPNMPKNKVIIDDAAENKTIRINFKIRAEIFNALAEKAVGDESVNQLCRAMLQPQKYIQPTSIELHKNVLSICTFYSSRIVSLGNTFNELIQEALSSHSKDLVKLCMLTNMIELMNQTDQLIQLGFGINLYNRNSGEKKTK